jgi:hypothetical protein
LRRGGETLEECLVGDVVGKLKSVSYGVGPPNQFDPCNFRSATSEFLVEKSLVQMQLSSCIEEADQGHCKCVHILKVPGQKGGVL